MKIEIEEAENGYITITQLSHGYFFPVKKVHLNIDHVIQTIEDQIRAWHK